MTAYLAGLGTAVPEMTINRAESLHVANCLCGPYMTDTDWLPNVYEHCGVQNRHQVLGRPLIEDLLAGTRTSGSPFLPGITGWADYRRTHGHLCPRIAAAGSRSGSCCSRCGRDPGR